VALQTLERDSLFFELLLDEGDAGEFGDALRVELNAVFAFEGEDRLQMAEGVPVFDLVDGEIGSDLFGRDLQEIGEDVTKRGWH